MIQKAKLIDLLKRKQEYGIAIEGQPALQFTVENHQIASHLLENGVIVPPCKVGDIVYLPNSLRTDFCEAVVEEIVISKHGKFIITRGLNVNARRSVFFENIGAFLRIFLYKSYKKQNF